MSHLPLPFVRITLAATALLALALPADRALALPLPSGLEDGCSFDGCQVVQWEEEAGGNGHYYAFVPVEGSQSWTSSDTAARASTIGAGSVGHLATLSSSSESAFVIASVLPTTYTHKRQVWLGGFQSPGALGPNEGWQYANPFNVEPEYWDYTNWAPGEANDEGVEGGDERFLAMWVQYYWNGLNYRGRWNDEDDVANEQAPIVGMLLEWEGPIDVPEPASALLVGLAAAALGLRRRALAR